MLKNHCGWPRDCTAPQTHWAAIGQVIAPGYWKHPKQECNEAPPPVRAPQGAGEVPELLLTPQRCSVGGPGEVQRHGSPHVCPHGEDDAGDWHDSSPTSSGRENKRVVGSGGGAG